MCATLNHRIFFLERNFKVINVKKALFTEKCKIKYKIESGLNRNVLTGTISESRCKRIFKIN